MVELVSHPTPVFHFSSLIGKCSLGIPYPNYQHQSVTARGYALWETDHPWHGFPGMNATLHNRPQAGWGLLL